MLSSFTRRRLCSPRLYGPGQTTDGSRDDDEEGGEGKISVSRGVRGERRRFTVVGHKLIHRCPQTDLRLVTGNGKLYNLPGTLYYTEADRIEAYALQHISRATATVIEYKTDWNIGVETVSEEMPMVDRKTTVKGRRARRWT